MPAIKDLGSFIILLRATDLGLGAVWCGMHPQKRPEARDQYDENWVHYIR